MSLVIVDNVAKTYLEDPLFEKVSFTIEKGHKVALVAPNGAGKTTLLKILARIEEPSKGELEYDPYVRIGYLQQEVELGDATDPWEYLYQAQSERMKLWLQYKELRADFEASGGVDASDEAASGVSLPRELKDALNHHDLWSYDEQIRTMMQEFKLDESVSLKHYSGGQRKRPYVAPIDA